jgi:predicted SnoaL-like aldol condensation-catalyzing enzyme
MSSCPDGDRTEANKTVVVESYNAMLNRHDIDEAIRHFGKNYIQHNPTAPDGIAGFRPFFAAYIEQYPDSTVEIKRVLADGDFVVMHVHLRLFPADRGRAAVEIFRLEGGKIVEHWDVIQPIPEQAANSNTMF